MKKQTLKRASLIVLLLLLSLLVLAACGGGDEPAPAPEQAVEAPAAVEQTSEQIQQAQEQMTELAMSDSPATLATYAAVAKANGLDGTTIVVSWPSLSHFDKARSVAEEFSAATGIKVELDYIEYQAMRDKQILELGSPQGQGEYDVVAWVVFNKTDFVNKGYLEDLSKYFTKANLADPTYDREDLVQAYVNSGAVAGGRRGYLSGPTSALYGVPFGAETSIMAYRQDIFDEYNLAVPTTYDEMFEVADFITAERARRLRHDLSRPDRPQLHPRLAAPCQPLRRGHLR